MTVLTLAGRIANRTAGLSTARHDEAMTLAPQRTKNVRRGPRAPVEMTVLGWVNKIAELK